MKKILSLLFSALLLIGTLSIYSCSGEPGLYSSGTGDVKVVCTVFPIFDITRNVSGGNATVTLLQDNGADPHSYTPTAAALKAVGEADIFVYTGGPSDSEWAKEMIASSEKEGLITINLSEHMDELITPENTCEWTEHDHGNDHSENFDEHFWSSPENAIKLANAVKTTLCEVSPDLKNEFEASCSAYTEKLSALSDDYKQAFGSATSELLVFADRFPFVYLLHDYSFDYVAAFGGCSSETDASYETLDAIVSAVKSNSLSAVLVIEGSDKKLASTVSEQTGCSILTVNSLQSVTRKQIDCGITYLDTMKENLTVFREALGSK